MKLLFIILALCIAMQCAAQNGPPKEIHLNRLFIEDGLPEGHINKFLQDKEGYMWMATFDGIVRFDGYTAKRYDLPSPDLRTSPVLDICEDSSGTLWVADYYHGLYQYDRMKNRFVHYQHDKQNKHSIAEGYLRSITADNKGNIWLAILNTDQKSVTIDRYETASKSFTHYLFSDKKNFITSSLYRSPLFKDVYGNIWLGSQNGLQRFNFSSQKFDWYLHNKDSLNQKTVENICADPLSEKVVWLSVRSTATNGFEGLLRFDFTQQRLTSYRHSNDAFSLPSDTVLNIQADSKKRLWVTTTKGLSLFNSARNNFYNYCPSQAVVNPSAGHITKFEEDKDGNFWFSPASGIDPNSTANMGLFFFNPVTNRFANYRVNVTQRDGLTSNIIRNLYIDHSGILWINSSAAGAEWINSRRAKFTLHAYDETRKSFFPTDFLNSCAEAKDGSVWMATTGGLYRWFPQTDSLALISIDKKRGNHPLLSVLIDEDGLVWYSGDDISTLQGLFCYHPSTGQLNNYRVSKDSPQPLESDFIHHIIQSYTGKLLLCTDDGLYSFDKTKKVFKQYKYDAAGNSALRRTKQYADLVWTAFEDREHTLWLGTLGSLTKLDLNTGTFTYYQKNLSHFQWIQNYYQDNRQRIWASSYNGGGLLMFNKKTNIVKRLSEKDGLLFNGPGCVLEDDEGNLWVKSVRGISIINPTTFAIRNFTDDVLTEPNHLINYSFKTSKGLFIFPSKYGFVTLHPEDFAPNLTAPIIHIESISFLKPDAKQKRSDSLIATYSKPSISLNYNENRLTFSYVGLLYQNTQQIRYKYKLDGYDNNWINAGAQRAVTYTNLNPGTYTFHVNAANSDGIWSRNEDAITIIIAPPFWETWWYKIAVILLISVVVYFAVMYFVKQKLKAQQLQFERMEDIQKIRSKISMDIHDEISSGLTKISLLSQRIKTKFQKNRQVDGDVVDKIADTSKEVIDNLGEIIWATNPKHDNLPSLLAYIRNYTTRFFEDSPVAFTISFPQNIPDFIVSPDVKHNLFLVMKEALNNIIKHADATEASLQFHYSGNEYHFIITDNGKGMSGASSNAFGNGLINMQKRMEAIGGSLSIRSENGKGCSIRLAGDFEIKNDA